MIATDEVDALGARLYDGLSIEDLNSIQQDLCSVGKQTWEAWCEENTAAAIEIIRTQGQTLGLYPPTERRRLTCLVLSKLRRTAALLNIDFTPVRESKDLAEIVGAASAVVEQLEKSCREWPLDGPS